jgi:hypothetical protein
MRTSRTCYSTVLKLRLLHVQHCHQSVKPADSVGGKGKGRGVGRRDEGEKERGPKRYSNGKAHKRVQVRVWSDWAQIITDHFPLWLLAAKISSEETL